MTEKDLGIDPDSELPPVAVEKRQHLSLVWLIPLIAILIGVWLAYKTVNERGPVVTISFKEGSGLEAGKTKIKYRAVEVGQIEKVEIKEDLSGVVVTAALVHGTEPHLTENTKFWVVRPRVGVGGISGLETIVSGAYIDIDLLPGTPAREFKGLETPPLVKSFDPGTQYVLKAKKLGSAYDGSPVYLRDIQVGEILSHELAADNESVLLHIFIKSPHDQRVTTGTRFWEASGLDVSINAEGVNVQMASLASLLAGGVAFDTPVGQGQNQPSQDGAAFPLYESFKSIRESSFVRKVPYLMYFDGSVRGLTVGAPVDFRGIRVGTVTDVKMELNPETLKLRIPVMVELEPERVIATDVAESLIEYDVVGKLIQRGLRAQLQMSSLLTGQLFVSLELYPDLPRKSLVMTEGIPIFPTVPSSMDALRRTLTDVVDKIGTLPLDKITYELLETIKGAKRFTNSRELGASVKSMNSLLKDLRTLAHRLDKRVGTLTASTEEGMKQLSATARSVRILSEYLERHPEALLHGKGSGK